MRPRLLDLFCGAGGAGMGYHRAGFDVTGVDIKPMQRYPFEFIQADALEYVAERWHEYDVIHASPPCQAYTHARHIGHRGRSDHPMLVDAVRQILRRSGFPYVIENVKGAPMENPIMLCGSAFGLGVQRHRLFESNMPLLSPGCAHVQFGMPRFPGTPGVDGTARFSRIVNPMSSGVSHTDLANAMSIDWIPQSGFRPTNELQQAIPPAYTEFIGRQLMAGMARYKRLAGSAVNAQ